MWPTTSRNRSTRETALELLKVSFNHPIRLIANALGVPPKAMIEMGKKHDVPVAALVGAKEHALRQVAAGVDILVVQVPKPAAIAARSRPWCWCRR